MWFLLFILSFILVVALTPVGIIYTLAKTIITWNYSYLNNYYKGLAISLDQFGNVAMAGLFNGILIWDTPHKFGNPDETISSVLGKNKRDGTLKYLGRRLDALLNGLDKDHSIKSIGS